MVDGAIIISLFQLVYLPHVRNSHYRGTYLYKTGTDLPAVTTKFPLNKVSSFLLAFTVGGTGE
jgi:hypothetical protein